MKSFLVLACVALASAAPEAQGGYSYPAQGGNNNFIGGSIGSGISGGSGGNFVSGGQTHRHVYVHVAPDDPEDQQARVIRIPSRNDKHVNIIFVKTPSQSASAQTEVILPEQDQQKNIVYVLVKKFDPSTDLKLRAPRPTSPAKPEVYFIRYNNNQQQGQNGGQPGNQYGPPPPPPSNPAPQYGLPSF